MTEKSVKTVCCQCGSMIEVEIEDEGEGCALGCIPWTGPEKGLLAGLLTMRDGTRIYRGPQGESWTREEAIVNTSQGEVEWWDAKALSQVIQLGRRARKR